jgi:hypothetical protein
MQKEFLYYAEPNWRNVKYGRAVAEGLSAELLGNTFASLV